MPLDPRWPLPAHSDIKSNYAIVERVDENGHTHRDLLFESERPMTYSNGPAAYEAPPERGLGGRVMIDAPGGSEVRSNTPGPAPSTAQTVRLARERAFGQRASYDDLVDLVADPLLGDVVADKLVQHAALELAAESVSTVDLTRTGSEAIAARDALLADWARRHGHRQPEAVVVTRAQVAARRDERAALDTEIV